MKANQRIIFNRAVAPLDRTWHQIEVVGTHPTVYNGRRIEQVIDRTALEMIVDHFATQAQAEHFAGLLVNRDHLAHDPSQSTEAMGWLKAVEIRNGQLWGEIEWTDLGAEAVKNRRYKFFSTEYPAAGLVELAADRIRPTKLGGIALTNLPNNKGGQPISNRDGADAGLSEKPTQTNNNDEPTMKPIAKKLGLSEEATEEQILNRVGELQAELAGMKTKAAEAEADAVLNRFGDRIPADAKAGWRTQLIANREGAEQLLKASFPEAAQGGGGQGAGAAQGGDGAGSAGGAPRIFNRAGAQSPDPSRAGSEGGGGPDMAAIRNRAQVIAKETGQSFDASWNQALKEAAGQ